MLSAVVRSGCMRLQPVSRQLLPNLTQVSYLSDSSVKHWRAERYVSILTVGAMVGAAVYPTLAFDHALAILVPLHTHWGIEQVCTDYVPNTTAMAIISAILKVVTALTIVTLLYFNQHDIGITQAVKDLWNIRRIQPEELS